MAAIIKINKDIILKKSPGLYSLNKVAIVFITFTPSLYVFNFDTLPAGLSLYCTGISFKVKFLSIACIVISVSISKPFESTG